MADHRPASDDTDASHGSDRESRIPDRIEKPDARRAETLDIDAARETFSWLTARDDLAGLPGHALAEAINIAHECVDRHLGTPTADRVAIRWIGKDDARVDLTYAELAARSNRFANVLAELGVARGERIFTLSHRLPDLYVAVIGALKRGCVVSPLFSAFGPEPIATRVNSGEGAVIVTTERLFARKLAELREQLPSLRHVLLLDGDPSGPSKELDGVHALGPLMEEADDDVDTAPTAPEDMALLHFTSGTTGKPKGAVHVHEAVVAHRVTGQYALDLRPGDVFWCTADPGWVTGMSYGIISPLCNGCTLIVDEAELDAERWYGILECERVNVWYTAPTAVRMLMKVGEELPQGFDLSALRFVASVGEPLNPEAVVWGSRALGMPIHDNWWQTETGGIMIANTASMDIKPGSMGKPLPGIEAGIVRRRTSNGSEQPSDEGADELVEVTEPDVEGELALRPGWPSMFRAYLGQEERYASCFADGWYLSGDLARRDDDGYFWFVGRADDVINTAGHLVGPFEVESVLMEHPAVAEVGVIGKPDPVAMEIVKAFVVLHQRAPDADPVDASTLERELRGLARKRLGPAVAPREIELVDELPKTRSGKIMRRLLKARELGLPEGDTSTLVEPGSA